MIVEPALRVQAADVLEHVVEGLFAGEHTHATVDVGLGRRERVLQHRLADLPERPDEARGAVVLEHRPQVVDVRDREDEDPRARRASSQGVHRCLELRLEQHRVGHLRLGWLANVVAAHQHGHVVDPLGDDGRHLPVQVAHQGAAPGVVVRLALDGRVERPDPQVVTVYTRGRPGRPRTCRVVGERPEAGVVGARDRIAGPCHRVRKRWGGRHR